MLIKILVLHASGQGVSSDYGYRVIDATKIDEVRSDEHVRALDKDGKPLPDVDGKAQYEPKAVHLIHYLHGAGAQPIRYSVRGTIGEWRKRLNAARFTQVQSLDQPEPEE